MRSFTVMMVPEVTSGVRRTAARGEPAAIARRAAEACGVGTTAMPTPASQTRSRGATSAGGRESCRQAASSAACTSLREAPDGAMRNPM